MSCSTYPYNINNMNDFDNYITNVNYIDNVDASNNIIDFSLWKECINNQKDNLPYYYLLLYPIPPNLCDLFL